MATGQVMYYVYVCMEIAVVGGWEDESTVEGSRRRVEASFVQITFC